MNGAAPVREIEHQWIAMADGVRLAARLWLPGSAGEPPVPAVFETIPYRKRDLTRLRDERNHAVFAAAGYASIRVDMRGSGDSEGRMGDMFTPEELDDAISVIDWIAAQPWCDGNVGMFGQSWGGTACLLAACRRPAALKAVLPCCATADRFGDDIHHMGGCLLTDTVEWGAHLPAILASPPDPRTVGDGWRSQWMARLEALTFPLETWIRHEWRDDYWRRSSVCETPHEVACPVLAVGGWSDRYSNTVMSLVARLGTRCWGIVGPWGHHYPFAGSPGPAIGFQQEALRWWDRWLKGIDNGIDREPRLRVWRMEYQPPADRVDERPGRWIAEDAWPSARVAPHAFGLAGGRLAPPADAAGERAEVPSAGVVGPGSGDTGYFGRAGGLPLDQASDDAASLVFESDPLDEPFDLLGEAVLELDIVCDRPVATLAARLNDVPAKGGVARVACAVRNLALDDGGVPDNALGAGGRRRCRIVFPNTAYRFQAGHRVRLALSSSYWPQIWPAPEAALIAVETGDARLVLPRRSAADTAESPVAFAPPLAQDNRGATVLRAPAIERTFRSEASGRMTVAWRNAPSPVRFAATGLDFGSQTRCEHSIVPGDHESAHCRVEHRLSYRRADWFVEVSCTAELTATKTVFRPRGHLVVRENDAVLFERRWSPDVPRTCS